MSCHCGASTHNEGEHLSGGSATFQPTQQPIGPPGVPYAPRPDSSTWYLRYANPDIPPPDDADPAVTKWAGGKWDGTQWVREPDDETVARIAREEAERWKPLLARLAEDD